MRYILILLLGVVVATAQARVEVHTFDSPEQEARYNQLIDELRCLVCQNQNLADSNAELAVDMRRKTYEMVREGRSKKEVADFMVERYGEFVLYRPPFNSNTLLLWIGPFVILIAGVAIMLRTIANRRRETGAVVDQKSLQAAASLLETEQEKKDT
jgi:cytochrome c-type biogenesis protein CcmH